MVESKQKSPWINLVSLNFTMVKEMVVLDAVSNALQRHSDMHYSIVTYQEHALNVGSNSQACAYVGVQEPNGTITWGAGIHEDIITASVLALIECSKTGLISKF